MDRLTKRQIENIRICQRGREGYAADVTTLEVVALCDMALQSLSQEAVRDEALEEALRFYAGEVDGQHWGEAMLEDGGRRAKAALVALKREPNNVLAPGERKPGEIAGPTNDTRESARVKSTAIGQVDCASEEQVSNPVEDTNKREPNAAAEPHEYVDAPTGAIEEHGPAPAAPDVAEVLSDWRVVAEFFASRNWPDTKLGDAASRLHARLPALLAKLGQGWIPVSDEESLGAYLTGLPGKPIYAVDERTQPFSCWRFELPPLPPRP